MWAKINLVAVPATASNPNLDVSLGSERTPQRMDLAKMPSLQLDGKMASARTAQSSTRRGGTQRGTSERKGSSAKKPSATPRVKSGKDSQQPSSRLPSARSKQGKGKKAKAPVESSGESLLASVTEEEAAGLPAPDAPPSAAAPAAGGDGAATAATADTEAASIEEAAAAAEITSYRSWLQAPGSMPLAVRDCAAVACSNVLKHAVAVAGSGVGHADSIDVDGVDVAVEDPPPPPAGDEGAASSAEPATPAAPAAPAAPAVPATPAPLTLREEVPLWPPNVDPGVSPQPAAAATESAEVIYAAANLEIVAACAEETAAAAKADEQFLDDEQEAWTGCEASPALDVPLGATDDDPAVAPIRLIDARFLIALARDSGKLVRRQDLPDGAFFDLAYAARLSRPARHKGGAVPPPCHAARTPQKCTSRAPSPMLEHVQLCPLVALWHLFAPLASPLSSLVPFVVHTYGTPSPNSPPRYPPPRVCVCGSGGFGRRALGPHQRAVSDCLPS